MPMNDYKDMTPEQLMSAELSIRAERERRQALQDAPAQVDALVERYQAAMGREGGSQWVQPTGPLDSYPRGAVHSHGGQVWSSTVSTNVWEPGVSGWRLVGEIGEDGIEIPAPYLQPTGAHDAYQTGELITWTDDEVYAAARDGVVHSPADAPADWTLQVAETDSAEEEPEQEPADPDQNDPEAGQEPPEVDQDTILAWQVLAGYEEGDKVAYKGDIYTVLQAHTAQAHWTPEVAGALYEMETP